MLYLHFSKCHQTFKIQVLKSYSLLIFSKPWIHLINQFKFSKHSFSLLECFWRVTPSTTDSEEWSWGSGGDYRDKNGDEPFTAQTKGASVSLGPCFSQTVSVHYPFPSRCGFCQAFSKALNDSSACQAWSLDQQQECHPGIPHKCKFWSSTLDLLIRNSRRGPLAICVTLDLLGVHNAYKFGQISWYETKLLVDYRNTWI